MPRARLVSWSTPRARSALWIARLSWVLVAGSVALGLVGPTSRAAAQERVRPDRIREMQMNQRVPAAGHLTVTLADGATAELAITVFGVLNGPLDRSFLGDRDALRGAIDHAIGDRTCDRLDEPALLRALREAIAALMTRPEELAFVSLDVASCEAPLYMSLPE